MIDPEDKKKLLEENHYLDPNEADLIDDEQYIAIIADTFEAMDSDDTCNEIDEDLILAEFGYLNNKTDE